MPKVIFCLSSSLIVSSTILKNEGRLWTFLKSINLFSSRFVIRWVLRIHLVWPVIIRCLVLRTSGVVYIWPLIIRCSWTHSLSPPNFLKAFVPYFDSGHFLKDSTEWIHLFMESLSKGNIGRILSYVSFQYTYLMTEMILPPASTNLLK